MDEKGTNNDIRYFADSKKQSFRKPIAISTTDTVLAALCDDGSLWTFRGDNWHRLPNIPTDKE